MRLDGEEWQLRGCLGREWEWHLTKPWDAPGWLPARVPGSVLDDLARAGEVPDLYYERNSRLAEWVAERAWIYRTRLRDGGVLRFDGVDYACRVFLDGKELARNEGCFVPFEVDVPARGGVLAVVVEAAPESEPQVGATSRVRVHKPRMNYGWDFCPRLVHQGIWQPVTLDGRPPSRVFPTVAIEDGVGVVRGGGDEVHVERPELWWPNGMGEQRLYRVTVGGREFEVGFRTVELDDYTLVVNGVRVPIKGWNWVPIDALYGVPRPEKLAHLLRLAARAHVNLLRVWGGGLIETEEFYSWCDRLGLLVWQEFSLSSSGMESVPSDDPEFVARLAREARTIVPLRRRHPSLAIWCGGNELDAGDSTPAIAALRTVVRELDPERAWLPTSPFGGPDEDVHGPWEHQGLALQTRRYDDGTWRLHSEFGVEGMTNRAALEALIGETHRLPPDRSNPVYEHLGAWWNNVPLVQECFGGRLDTLELMLRASQWLQYEGLRYAVESNLRRGAGTIPWQLGESYPNAWCTSAVDWHGRPKPAYWGVARAYRPGHVSASFETWAWGGREQVVARPFGHVSARVVDVYGNVVSDSAVAPVDAIATDVFVLDLDGRNRYVMTTSGNLAPMLDLPVTQVYTDVDVGSGVHLHNSGEAAAIGVVLVAAHPWTAFDDNVFVLLPGESRTIAVEWHGEPRLQLDGWNVRA